MVQRTVPELRTRILCRVRSGMSGLTRAASHHLSDGDTRIRIHARRSVTTRYRRVTVTSLPKRRRTEESLKDVRRVDHRNASHCFDVVCRRHVPCPSQPNPVRVRTSVCVLHRSVVLLSSCGAKFRVETRPDPAGPSRRNVRQRSRGNVAERSAKVRFRCNGSASCAQSATQRTTEQRPLLQMKACACRIYWHSGAHLAGTRIGCCGRQGIREGATELLD